MLMLNDIEDNLLIDDKFNMGEYNILLKSYNSVVGWFNIHDFYGSKYKNGLYISNFRIVGAFQGKGLAGKMLDYAQGMFDKLWLQAGRSSDNPMDQKSLVKFYNRHGFLPKKGSGDDLYKWGIYLYWCKPLT